MADNIDVTPGSGKTIAADEVGGALYQRVKVVWGPDGTANDSDTATGKPLPVQVRSATGLVPIGEPTDAKNGATDTTSVSLISLVKQISFYLAGALGVNGGAAHDAADAGAPIKVGNKATTSLAGLTLVADGDISNAFAGIDGVPIVRPHCNLEDIVTGNASNTDGSSTQCIASSGSGVKTYLTSVILTNTSSSNIYVEIKDGSTAKATIPVPANSGAIFNPPVPIPGTAATAWNFDASAATTTLYCSMVGFKSKV